MKLIDLESALRSLIFRVWNVTLLGSTPLFLACPERLRMLPSPVALRVEMVWATVLSACLTASCTRAESAVLSMMEREEPEPEKVRLIPLLSAPVLFPLLSFPAIVPLPLATLMLIVPWLAVASRLLVRVPLPVKLIFAVPALLFPAVR